MDRCLVFSTSNEFLRVSPDAVAYIKADGNYSTITTADGTDYRQTVMRLYRDTPAGRYLKSSCDHWRDWL